MQALRTLASSLLFSLTGPCIEFVSANFSTADIRCYLGIVGMLFI